MLRGGGPLGMHYSTGRDYVFPLIDAAYRAFLIFLYLLINIKQWRKSPIKEILSFLKVKVLSLLYFSKGNAADT